MVAVRRFSYHLLGIVATVAFFMLSCGSSKPIVELYNGVEKFKIIAAYALLYDGGDIRKIDSKMIGHTITIDSSHVAVDDQNYGLNNSKKENISLSDFGAYHVGMNYAGISPDVFGINGNDNAGITHITLHDYDDNHILGDDLFYANNKLLTNAVAEYKDTKSNASDLYFYLAERY